MIPYGRQSISDADVEAVTQVLRSDFLTQGPQVPAFEQAVASYVGAQHAVAVNSATSALHIACLALNLGPGDLLWTSPNSFVASSNCALYCGADVDFVDIDPRTYNLCPVALKRKLEQARTQGKRLPKVVVPVHFAGQSCDMATIAALAKEYDFKIIEDASHAIGGRWQNQFIGACTHSDITVFSFHPVKIITTAEGGLLTTNDAELATRLADLRSHGITRDTQRMVRKNEGAWYYEQQSLGLNYRMTELQAALGLSQMARLAEFVATRHTLAARYNEALAELPLTLPWQHPDSYSAFHLYVIQLQPHSPLNRKQFNRRQLFDALRESGIYVNVHYIPIHTQPYYETLGFKLGDFPQAEHYYQQAISLPMYAGLDEKSQDFVISRLKELLQ